MPLDPIVSTTVRTAGDVDQLVQIKIVDYANPSNGATVSAGSLNVQSIPYTPPNGSEISNFDQITSVASNSSTRIISYTVPVTNTFYLNRVGVNGDNIAQYTLKINSIAKDIINTTFTQLNNTFNYWVDNNQGYKLNAGDVLEIWVIHTRPYVGSFNARIQGLQIG